MGYEIGYIRDFLVWLYYPITFYFILNHLVNICQNTFFVLNSCLAAARKERERKKKLLLLEPWYCYMIKLKNLLYWIVWKQYKLTGLYKGC